SFRDLLSFPTRRSSDLIGAVYLDQGYNATADFIFKKIIENHVDLDRLERTIASHKSLILEWGQKTKNRIGFNTFEEENAEDLTRSEEHTSELQSRENLV